MEPAGLSQPICKRCGVVAPTRSEVCEHCRAKLAESRVLVPVDPALTWTAVRASFDCRACGFPSPLDGILEADGCDCARCGTFQRVDGAMWSASLPRAHEVGDLGGPHPEGIHPAPHVFVGDVNPHRTIGDLRTFSTLREAGYTVEVAPGHPVCPRCHRPLDARVHRGTVETRCPGCGDAGAYQSPPAHLATATMLGAVGGFQRTDRRMAAVKHGAGGLVALVCPQCGAAVEPKPDRTATCAYCHATSWIPPRGGRENEPVEPIVFFVAFDARSPLRAQLEQPAPSEKEKSSSVFGRSLDPIPGVALAPQKPGLDWRQLALNGVLGGAAIAIGYGLYALISG